jgi:hypothetical protein
VWAFVWVEERRDLAAGGAAAVAALSRPNGVILIVALLIAVGFVTWRMVRLAAPVIAAIAVWLWFNALRTGDPLRFLDAKRAWHEVTLVGIVERPTGDALVHLGLAAVALTLVLLVRRRVPRSWIWFTSLYLLPSLGLGVVGLARYASETFPPYIAGGSLLEGTRRRRTATVFSVLLVTQACCAFYFITVPQVI